MRFCSIRGCNRPHEAKGLCRRHYRRLYRHGNPLAGKQPRGAAAQWLLAHVRHAKRGCLIWPFGRHKKGYPRGVELPGQPLDAAHRAMCRLAHGPPPTPKHQAAHSCHNGRLGCVHPKHLRWASDAENRADRRDRAAA